MPAHPRLFAVSARLRANLRRLACLVRQHAQARPVHADAEEGRGQAIGTAPATSTARPKKPGLHGGAVGHSAMLVLQSLIFDFLNYRTGRLDPSYAAIARKANVCERVVASGIQRLRDLGILTWVRRCAEYWRDGRYVREQQTNAYAVLPCSGWRGYTPPPEAPAPLPGTWGAPPRMPDVHEAAIINRKTGGDPQTQLRILDLAPRGSLEAALASFGRAVLGTKT